MFFLIKYRVISPYLHIGMLCAKNIGTRRRDEVTESNDAGYLEVAFSSRIFFCILDKIP